MKERFGHLLHCTVVEEFGLGLFESSQNQTVVGAGIYTYYSQWNREITEVRDDTYGDINQINLECAMFKF